MIVAPSVLSADFSKLAYEMDRFNKSNAMWVHYDVLDGNFAPNISFGPAILKQMTKLTDKFIDVHLMVINPYKAVDYFDGCRVDSVTFHYECFDNDKDIFDMIDKIKSKGYKAGISIKPKTPVEVLDKFLDKVDMVLIMSVEPGFSGQKFMPDMMSKGDYLDAYRKEHNLDFLLQIDGGINGETCKVAKQHHFDCLVTGSYAFNAEDFSKAVDSLLQD